MDKISPTDAIKNVVLSHCELYRYALSRWWGPGPIALFVLLNPSKADDVDDDPTLRRLLGYADAWGCGGLLVGNLFAWRSSKPAPLMTAKDPLGPLNMRTLLELALMADRIVVGWGTARAVMKNPEHVSRVYGLLRAVSGRELESFQLTKAGRPGHPLFLKGDLTPALYPPDQFTP